VALLVGEGSCSCFLNCNKVSIQPLSLFQGISKWGADMKKPLHDEKPQQQQVMMIRIDTF
jgi:hypothetical protein